MTKSARTTWLMIVLHYYRSLPAWKWSHNLFSPFYCETSRSVIQSSSAKGDAGFVGNNENAWCSGFRKMESNGHVLRIEVVSLLRRERSDFLWDKEVIKSCRRHGYEGSAKTIVYFFCCPSASMLVHRSMLKVDLQSHRSAVDKTIWHKIVIALCQ
jgi:hypothetical protein